MVVWLIILLFNVESVYSVRGNHKMIVFYIIFLLYIHYPYFFFVLLFLHLEKVQIPFVLQLLLFVVFQLFLGLVYVVYYFLPELTTFFDIFYHVAIVFDVLDHILVDLELCTIHPLFNNCQYNNNKNITLYSPLLYLERSSRIMYCPQFLYQGLSPT